MSAITVPGVKNSPFCAYFQPISSQKMQKTAIFMTIYVRIGQEIAQGFYTD
jgi:hypothetical protein